MSRTGDFQVAIAESGDGPDLLTSGRIEGTEMDAWHAAFELYRVARIC